MHACDEDIPNKVVTDYNVPQIGQDDPYLGLGRNGLVRLRGDYGKLNRKF
jgi:hypothetical protein